MKNKQTFKVVGGVAIVIALALMFNNGGQTTKVTSTDAALLTIVKNDQKGFEAWVKAGGDIHAPVQTVDGKTLTVIESVVANNRVGFVEFLQKEKMPFVVQDTKKDYDVVSLAAKQKDPAMLKVILKEKPKLDRQYGKEGWTVMHMASAECSEKVVGMIHKTGMNWDIKAKDGSTPLTVAAKKDCVPVLNYWKENKADFKAKDGTGKSPMTILETKLEADRGSELSAFTVSFSPTSRRPASEQMIPNFYNKKKFPKDRLAKQNDTLELEPEDRPEEAYETADYSEFAD